MASTFSIRSGGAFKELSYTCFPVKLFRLVSAEKYTSLWWANCGSHFVVDVPRFEQEILRNDAIPEEDGFKTIAFTSFIRQLNLYGFRKVTVSGQVHDDPQYWQRYAHPFFLRDRVDCLDKVKRQNYLDHAKSPANPFRLQNRDNDHSSAFAEDRSRVYEKPMTQVLLRRGMCPSRKGPKPKFAATAVDSRLRPMRRTSSRRRKQRLESSLGQEASFTVMPFNATTGQAIQEYVVPANLSQAFYAPQIVPERYVIEAVTLNPDATIIGVPAGANQPLPGGLITYASEPMTMCTNAPVWQTLQGNAVDVLPQELLQVNSVNVAVTQQSASPKPKKRVASMPNPIETSTAEKQFSIRQEKSGNVFSVSKTQNQSSSSLSLVRPTERFDSVLTAAALGDDSVVSPQNFVIDDVDGSWRIWPEGSHLQNTVLSTDDVVFG